MRKLTDRQSAILDFLKHHIDEEGYPPTRADIARKFGFRSPNAAEEHLKALRRKGVIEMSPHRSRAIRILRSQPAGLPVVGRVAAGSPILAQEHIEDTCELSGEFFRPQADYLLRVRGDSMTGAGILDGDLLAVHKTSEARNGQIVVARIEDEVTVKRFQRVNRARVLLLPENEDYDAIEVDLRQQEAVIEGLSVGVIRRG